MSEVQINITQGATGPQGPAGPQGPQGPAGAAGSTTLDGLTDTTLATPATDQFLGHDGTDWKNRTAAQVRASLDVPQTAHNHSGADITSGTVAVARGGTGAGDAATARTNLGAQAQDALLDDIAALSATKGQLMVGDGSDVVGVAVGTDDHVLTADSTQASGVAWKAAAGGGVSATSPTEHYVPKFDSGGDLVDSKFRSDHTSGFADVMERFRIFYLGTTQALDVYGDGGAGRMIWQLTGYTGARLQHASAIELAYGTTVRMQVDSTGWGVFGNSSAQKAYNASPSTTDIRDILIDFGFMAAS